ncbi:MAG: hypothetical protein ACI9RO_001542, partial [Alteromonas macleodii]
NQCAYVSPIYEDTIALFGWKELEIFGVLTL